MMIVFKSNYSNDYLVTQRGFQAVVTAGEWANRFLKTSIARSISSYQSLNRIIDTLTSYESTRGLYTGTFVAGWTARFIKSLLMLFCLVAIEPMSGGNNITPPPPPPTTTTKTTTSSTTPSTTSTATTTSTSTGKLMIKSLMSNTHRRRRCDATVELSRVGVGGVNTIRN